MSHKCLFVFILRISQTETCFVQRFPKQRLFADEFAQMKRADFVMVSFSKAIGLEGGAMERLAVGLYDGMNQDWLAYRIAQIQYLVDGLEAIGVT